MIRLAITLAKLGIFALVVLVLGHWIQWGGMSVSDQVRVRMASPFKPQLKSQVRDESRESLKPPKAKAATNSQSSTDPAKAEALRNELRKSRVAETIKPPEKAELEALLKD